MDKVNKQVKSVLDNKEEFLKVFPKLKGTLEALSSPENKPGCTTCMRNKLTRDILTIIMMTDKDSIDVRPLLPLATDPSLLGALTYKPTGREYMPAPGSTLPNLRKDDTNNEERECCFDCTCKHLSQAMILTEEMFQGYPEHVKLALDHTRIAKKHASVRNKGVWRKLTELEKTYEELMDIENSRHTAEFHLSMALNLIKDILDKDNNHPLIVWRIIGHLGEAADECIEKDPELAAAIRNERLMLMDDPEYKPTVAILLDKARRKR